MNRIDTVFADLKKRNRPGFSAFLTGGDPDAATSLALLKAMPEAGVDFIELGMPFSDPMADGPAIQAADVRALAHGASLKGVLDLLREFRRENAATPVVLMGYANPVYRFGYAKFAEAAARAGADGVLVVDLPPEEDGELRRAAQKAGLHVIRLATPTTNDARLPAVLDGAGGFLYYVSITGITGAAAAAEESVRQALSRLRQGTPLPLVVGFGIKDEASAAAIAKSADAVVVGSALVQKIADLLDRKTPPAQIVEKVAAFAASLARAVHGARDKAAA